MLKPTLFLVAFILTFLILMFLMFSFFIREDTNTWIKWLILVCSILLGGVVGYLLSKSVKLGLLMLGGFLGFMGGYLLYLTVVIRFYEENTTVNFLSNFLLFIANSNYNRSCLRNCSWNSFSGLGEAYCYH